MFGYQITISSEFSSGKSHEKTSLINENSDSLVESDIGNFKSNIGYEPNVINKKIGINSENTSNDMNTNLSFKPDASFHEDIPIKSHCFDNNSKNNTLTYLKVIYPKLPYHERYEIYMQRRNEIFNKTEKQVSFIQKPKRSTLRYRKYFKLKKMARKLLISAIISNPTDKRFYAQVKFLEFNEYGLLDTGANISCIGADLANHPFHHYKNFIKCKSFVRTADGKRQEIKGWIEVDIDFKGQTKTIKLFIIPAISSRLILGIDFWKNLICFQI